MLRIIMCSEIHGIWWISRDMAHSLCQFMHILITELPRSQLAALSTSRSKTAVRFAMPPNPTFILLHVTLVLQATAAGLGA